ncbi:MAG: signal peptidase I [Bacteriovoracaceae bacterium]|jgi:signal peptidase I
MKPVPFSGMSMFPLLKDGDLILIENLEKEVLLGDIILFKDSQNGEFVVHRVIKEDPLITKGDWATLSETPSREEIFALVVGFSRKGRAYKFSKGVFFGLYLWGSKNLLSPVRIFRQISRLGLILTAPLLYSKD